MSENEKTPLISRIVSYAALIAEEICILRIFLADPLQIGAGRP